MIIRCEKKVQAENYTFHFSHIRKIARRAAAARKTIEIRNKRKIWHKTERGQRAAAEQHQFQQHQQQPQLGCSYLARGIVAAEVVITAATLGAAFPHCPSATARLFARERHTVLPLCFPRSLFIIIFIDRTRAPRARAAAPDIYTSRRISDCLSLSLSRVHTIGAFIFSSRSSRSSRVRFIFYLARESDEERGRGVCSLDYCAEKKRERQTHLGEELADSWIIHNAFAIYMCVCNVIARYSKSVLRAAAWRVSNNAWFVLFIIFRSYRRGLFSCRYDAKFCLISYCLSIIQTNVIRVYKMKQLYNDTFVQSQRFRRRKKTFTCDLRHSYREIRHP